MSSGNASSGVFAIIMASLAVAVIVTFVTGSFAHWPPLLLGIVVGLMAVRSIGQ